MMSSGREFYHQPLLDAQRSLRLLTILPGSSDSTICCKLEQLHPEPKTYTCLSYEWGPEAPTKGILLNGKTFTIRLNLWNFLHTARRFGFASQLWVDAVCINQADLTERSSQVKRMGEIYRYASQTIVWLGLSDEHLLDLLRLQRLSNGPPTPPADGLPAGLWQKLIEFLRERLDRVSIPDFSLGRATMDHCWHLMSEIWGQPDNPIFTSRGQEVLRRYLPIDRALSEAASSFYWTRAWILQEILVSETPVLLTPEEPLDVHLLIIFLHSWFHHENIQGLHPLDSVSAKQLQKTEVRNLYYVLRHDDGPRLASSKGLFQEAVHLSYRKACSDIRDHIFSVISMVEDGHNFPVDYTVTKERLFWQAMTFCLAHGDTASDKGKTVLIALEALRLTPPPSEQLVDMSDLRARYADGDLTESLHWARRDEAFLQGSDLDDCGLPALVWPVDDGLRYVPWHSTWLDK